jgi:hypothetical protein
MAYTKQPFCDDVFIKENTIIDVNADSKLIKTAIIDAQELYIEPALGTSLYNKIVDDMTANTLAGNYVTLVDSYILDTLKYYVLYVLAPNMLIKWRNRSVDTQSGENSTPVSMDDMRSIQKEFLNKAEAYKQRLNDYMIANQTLFPELYQNNTYDKKNPDNISFTAPMYLGSDDVDDRITAKFFA